jgi:hypothetical protein
MSQIAEKGKEKELTAPLKDGKIRPNDMTTVYSTGLGGFTKAGEPMEVHTVLAEKLIAQGKATSEPIADTKTKQK